MDMENHSSRLTEVVNKQLDGKCIIAVPKHEGIAFLSAHNIYSYDVEKLINKLNKEYCALIKRSLAKSFWSTRIVSKEAYQHIIDKCAPKSQKEMLNAMPPTKELMEFRLFYDTM